MDTMMKPVPAAAPIAHIDGAFCPVFHRAVELIGRRWTGAIVRALLVGINRFSDLAESIPELSDRMLSERLKELEAEGIVARTVIPETPVRIEYRLTEKGRALEPVLDAIGAWAGDWVAPHGPPTDPAGS
jgi:DNA-binding HxlR family transcriptional regulator